MWRTEILSTLMLYKYDNTIFNGFIVPVGLDKQLAIDTILTETADMSVIYTSPDMLKTQIDLWCRRDFHIWEELYKTMYYDYNPIENYDRHETEHILDVDEDRTTKDLKDKTDATTTGDYNGNESRKIAAFNNGLADSTQTDSSGHSSNTEDRTYSQTGTEVRNGTDDNWRTNHTHGNIGVTTTQEMIQQQRDIVQFNLIDYIVNSYKKNFCVMLY